MVVVVVVVVVVGGVVGVVGACSGMGGLEVHSSPASSRGGGAGPTAASAADEPDAFNILENGAIGTDTYSFLDSDGATDGNGGARIQHSYVFLNGAPGSMGKPTATVLTNHNDKRSKKEEMFDAQMEQYQRERAKGMPQMVMRQ